MQCLKQGLPLKIFYKFFAGYMGPFVVFWEALAQNTWKYR